MSNGADRTEVYELFKMRQESYASIPFSVSADDLKAFGSWHDANFTCVDYAISEYKRTEDGSGQHVMSGNSVKPLLAGLKLFGGNAFSDIPIDELEGYIEDFGEWKKWRVESHDSRTGLYELSANNSKVFMLIDASDAYKPAGAYKLVYLGPVPNYSNTISLLMDGTQAISALSDAFIGDFTIGETIQKGLSYCQCKTSQFTGYNRHDSALDAFFNSFGNFALLALRGTTVIKAGGSTEVEHIYYDLVNDRFLRFAGLVKTRELYNYDTTRNLKYTDELDRQTMINRMLAECRDSLK
jgi:hypothetical protein